MAIIYKISSPGGKVYVGSTQTQLCKRYAIHAHYYRRWKAGGKQYCSSFIVFDDAGGPEACTREVIEEVVDNDQVKIRERH